MWRKGPPEPEFRSSGLFIGGGGCDPLYNPHKFLTPTNPINLERKMKCDRTLDNCKKLFSFSPSAQILVVPTAADDAAEERPGLANQDLV